MRYCFFRTGLRFPTVQTAGVLLSLLTFTATGAPALDESLTAIRNVGPEGAGNREASKAWQVLAAQPVSALPTILAAMDGANDYAANWVSLAVDAVAAKGDPPLPALGEFLFDTSHHPRARYQAFQLIAAAQPSSAESLLAGFLADPSPELRRDAVDLWIGRAAAATNTADVASATLLYRQALIAARDAAQIDAIATSLSDLGQKVDLPDVFGFLMDWRVIGPFDNTGMTGFANEFPPEKELRFDAPYKGKAGPVSWAIHTSTNEHGVIDLNALLGRKKGVVAYATTEFHSERGQQVELRLGCETAWKIWLNGDLIFARDEYHMGYEVDQYRLPVTLRAGPNTILVKVCQNELKEDWTEAWEFQLRVTDTLGTPIRPTTSRRNSSH